MTATDRSAAEERESHSIASALAGATTWFAVFGSVAAWAVHLVALAGLACLGCDHGGARVAMHVITAGCLALAAVAVALSVRLAAAGDDDAGTSPMAWHKFLGLLGLIIGVVQIGLIVVEELDVLTLAGIHCG